MIVRSCVPSVLNVCLGVDPRTYVVEKSKALVHDFGLHDHGVLEKNMNGFMAHIGTSRLLSVFYAFFFQSC